MKKTSVLILALILTASIVLSACGQDSGGSSSADGSALRAPDSSQKETGGEDSLYTPAGTLPIVSEALTLTMAVSQDPNASGKVVLFPVDFSLEGYQAVFKNSDIWMGYLNSAFYTVLGTSINVAVTLMAAYPLARKTLPGRNFFTILFTFTMFFSGGMVPTYILIRDLHIMNTIWAMVLPGALSVYNMIITRTFLQTGIPNELLEASQIDGCSDARYFFTILLPLSKPVIAVITLYYAVGHWNAFFNAFLYLTNRKLYPLQIILREILIVNSFDPTMIVDEELRETQQNMADLMKYALIIVATVPMMLIYPRLTPASFP